MIKTPKVAGKQSIHHYGRDLREELHSLGLGKDPPSSHEISRRIEKSCR